MQEATTQKVQTEDTRERILNAAAEIFAERGFEDTTVREICSAAGVNLAAVNYHFRDKERLYIETIKRAHRLRVQQVPLPNWPPGTAASEKLHGFIRTMLTRMIGDPSPSWQVRLMMRELIQPTAACQELVHDFFRPHFELLQGVLRELLPPGTPERKLHMIAFSVVGQCLHYRVARHVVTLLVGEEEMSTYTVDQLAAHITSFTLAALGHASPLGKAKAKVAP